MGDGVNPREIIKVGDDLSGTFADGRNGGRRMKGRLAGGVRDQHTMAEMKVRMSALWRDGELYQVIAERVSDEFNLEGDKRLTANGVHYHLKNMKEQWRAMSLLHVDERQALILARYDQLEVLITEAYFASCAGRTTKNFEKQIQQARSKGREKELQEDIREEYAGRVNHRNKNNAAMQFEFNDGDLPETLILTDERIKRSKRREETPSGDPRFLTMLIDINDKRAALWGLKSKTIQTDDAERASLSDEQREERLAAVLQTVLNRKTSGGSLANTNLATPAPLGGWAEGEGPDAIQQQSSEEEPIHTVDEDDEVLGPEVGEDFEFEFDFSEDE